MKSLICYKNEINNCSRCALCQAVCPIFLLTKNDCTSPRGKFILLNEILKFGKKPSIVTKKYFRTCLDCGKCLNYCPTKIDMVKINKAFFEDFSKIDLLFKVLTERITDFLNSKFAVSPNVDINFPKVKKIVFLKEFHEPLPKAVSENIDIIECGAPLKFRFDNPKLYKLYCSQIADTVLNLAPDIIIVNNILCKLDFEKGLKKNKKIKVYNLKDFQKLFTKI